MGEYTLLARRSPVDDRFFEPTDMVHRTNMVHPDLLAMIPHTGSTAGRAISRRFEPARAAHDPSILTGLGVGRVISV